MRIDTSQLPIKTLVEVKKLEYSKIKPIQCPLLDDVSVKFNTAGFYHLTHNGRGHIRMEADARMRLNLLRDAPIVIRYADCLADVKIIPAERNNLHKEVTYYELRHRFSNGKKVTVIVRKLATVSCIFIVCVFANNSNKIATVEPLLFYLCLLFPA